MSFTETSIEVDEPDNSPYRINAILTVRLSQAYSQTVTVQYRTEDFTAKTATRDYIATSGTLYFYPGTTERTISVTVLDDTTVEESFERFRIELFEPTNATLGSNSVSEVNIHDFDQSAPYNLIAPATVMEGQGTFTLAVETATTPIVEYRHSVTVFDISDTAQQDNEFVGFNEVLAFDVDHNRRTLEVMLIDDDMDEPDKSFIIQMVRHVGDHSKAPYGVSQLTVTILDDDPATPTNLEIIENRTDPDLDHVAILQWDYSDAEGYLLESRDGTSGPWNCIVAGTYSSREPTGTATVSTTRGGTMAASQDWHFRVRNFTSQEFSYPGEATCDEQTPTTAISSAQWTTRATTSHQQTPWDRLRYPQSTPPCGPHGSPPASPSQPEPSTVMSRSRGTSHRLAATSLASPSTGNGREQPTHPTYASTGPPSPASSSPATGTRSSRPTKPPATRTSTSTRCTRSTTPYHPHGQRSGRLRRLPARQHVPLGLGHRHTDHQHRHLPELRRDLEYLNPPAPTGLTLETRFRGYRSDISTIIARWEDVGNAPGYKVRWRETNETDWREQGRSRKLEANANACSDGTIVSTLNDGRVWCSGKTASSSPPALRPGPGCSTQAPAS